MGSGSNSGGSSSRPLTGPERYEAFQYGTRSVNEGMRDIPEQTYDSPQAQTLSGGDYNRLEQSILNSNLAPLQRYERLERDRVNQDIADRGIYSSGIGVRAQGDVTERFAPAYVQAATNATQQRYNLESQEKQGINQFNMENSLRNYNAKWRPLDYLAGMYNQTGGAVSSGNSSGWNFAI